MSDIGVCSTEGCSQGGCPTGMCPTGGCSTGGCSTGGCSTGGCSTGHIDVSVKHLTIGLCLSVRCVVRMIDVSTCEGGILHGG